MRKGIYTFALISLLAMTPKISQANCLQKFCLEDQTESELCKEKDTGQPMLLDFWASWCPNCINNLMHLENISKKLDRQRIKALAINIDQQKEDADRYLREHPTNLNIVFDNAGITAESCDLESLPATIYFSADGKEIRRWYGSSLKTLEQIDAMTLHGE